jgi:uncharacterized protein YbjT (DUF2867 family)
MRLLVTGGGSFLGGYVLDEARRWGHEASALARSYAATVARHGADPLTRDLNDRVGLWGVSNSAQCSSLLTIASMGFGHGLRPTMIYRPRDRNLTSLLALLPRVRVLPMPGSGCHLQQSVHVADAASAVLNAAEWPESAGTCYQLAGPEPFSSAELLLISAHAVQSRTRFVPVPLLLPVAAARGYEMLAARPRISPEEPQELTKEFNIEDAAGVWGTYAAHSPRVRQWA